MGDENDENASLLAAVLQTAIDAIITIDELGIICHANAAVERLFGYSRGEVIGCNISMLMPEPDRSQHDQYLARYKQTRKAGIIGIGREVFGQRKDGTLIPIDLAISEVIVGGRVMFTGIMRDMTQRNRAEADLRIAEQRVIQSERLAAIGQMMTGLAHESRNALQRSRACLDMLALDLEDNYEQLDLVHRTRSALLELQSLYEEVRAYASPIVLERSYRTIDSVCLEAWKKLATECEPKAIELEITGQEVPACRIDRYRIDQVFRNIFENSMAVAPPASKISVRRTVFSEAQKKLIRVSIADQGPGIDPSQRDQVFEPFYTTKTRGTGLGLAICKRIIEAHGGRIFVGNPPFGAELVIELPVD